MNDSFIEEGLRAMSRGLNITIRMAATAAGLAALGACTTPPPPPPPPPPPVVEAVPIRPLPPGQASYVMDIPPVNSLGLRETVNLGISDDEKVWHFRSAWNVAALNCLDPQYQPILDAYSSYIKDYARPLKQVNDRIDAAYGKEYGKGRSAIQARESQMTMVYNYFALPPARADFCRTALGISQQYLASEKVDPLAFGLANFAAFEGPFERFFQAYEQYERESSAWDARYGERYGASQPGYVAVMRARAQRLPGPGADPSMLSAVPLQEAKVVDPETGAKIPVVPVDETRSSVPVIQPILNDAGEDDTPQN
ncbi:hypothetical protein [Qipengyuania mesophila]|nr:hypothetical protein [Qipengyuania mesophila]